MCGVLANKPSEQSLTVQVNNQAVIWKWPGFHADGAKNLTTELNIYCSEYSVKLRTISKRPRSKLLTFSDICKNALFKSDKKITFRTYSQTMLLAVVTPFCTFFAYPQHVWHSQWGDLIHRALASVKSMACTVSCGIDRMVMHAAILILYIIGMWWTLAHSIYRTTRTVHYI